MSDHKHETCRWTEDPICECWETACGQTAVFHEDYYMSDMGYRFCPYCGKPIEAVPYVPPEEDDDDPA